MKKQVLRTIDLAQKIGVRPEAIRYYERRGLLPSPKRAPSGYRIYTPEHVERIDFIKQCQALGFSLDEIKELMELKFRGSSPCQHVRDLLLDKIKHVEAQIAGLQTFRNDLLASVRECEKTLKRDRDDCCPVLERLEKPITGKESG